MVPRHERPGIAKVRRVRLVRARTLSLLALEVRVMSARLATADVVSEGAMSGGLYYGTTDVCVSVAEDERENVAALAARDPHVRLRVLRLARREACARAEGSLGTIRAEVSVSLDERGVRIRVDVEARAFGARPQTTLGA